MSFGHGVRQSSQEGFGKLCVSRRRRGQRLRRRKTRICRHSGARFKLAMSGPQIAALNLPVWKRAILRALARFGGFVGGTGGPGFGFLLEDSTMYTALGAPDPLAELGEGQGVPTWERPVRLQSGSGRGNGRRNLRVLDPPPKPHRTGTRTRTGNRNLNPNLNLKPEPEPEPEKEHRLGRLRRRRDAAPRAGARTRRPRPFNTPSEGLRSAAQLGPPWSAKRCPGVRRRTFSSVPRAPPTTGATRSTMRSPAIRSTRCTRLNRGAKDVLEGMKNPSPPSGTAGRRRVTGT